MHIFLFIYAIIINHRHLYYTINCQRYRAFGDPPSQRSAEDIAYSVINFFARGGSFVSYYMVSTILSTSSFMSNKTFFFKNSKQTVHTHINENQTRDDNVLFNVLFIIYLQVTSCEYNSYFYYDVTVLWWD